MPVEPLVAELPVEAFHVTVCVGQPGSIRMCSMPCCCVQAMKARLVNSGPIVGADGAWIATEAGCLIEKPHDVRTADTVIRRDIHALAREVIDHG